MQATLLSFPPYWHLICPPASTACPQQCTQSDLLKVLTRSHSLLPNLQWLFISLERENPGFPAYEEGPWGSSGFSSHTSTHHTNNSIQGLWDRDTIWLPLSLSLPATQVFLLSWTYHHSVLFYTKALIPVRKFHLFAYLLTCFFISVFGLSLLECKNREGKVQILSFTSLPTIPGTLPSTQQGLISGEKNLSLYWCKSYLPAEFSLLSILIPKEILRDHK